MATYTVNSAEVVAGTSPGILTLRQALALADANATADTITFAAGLPDIVLTQGQLTTNSDVTIDGGVGMTINANKHSRVRAARSGQVSLDSLTITGGFAADSGGGIHSDGALTLINSTVSGNEVRVISQQQEAGGGIFGQSVTLIDSTVSGNTCGSYYTRPGVRLRNWGRNPQ